MSHAQIQAAATLAQTTLAQYMGMSADADGNGSLDGRIKLTGVYGTPFVREEIQPGGGYRRRTVLPYSFTREQLDAPPDTSTRKLTFTRLDLTPNITYRVDTIDAHQPINYVLFLVKLGE